MFRTTTRSLRRCTVTTAVLVAVGATTLGFGATAAVADTSAPSTTGTTAATGAPAPTEAAADATPADTNADADADDPTPTSTPTPTAAPAPAVTPKPTATPAAVPPTAAAAPTATEAGSVTVDGTPTTWHTLRARTSGWPTGTTFTYQWTVSGPVIGTRVVAGATSDTYVLDPADVSNDLTVAVTGTAPGEAPATVTSGAVHVDTDRDTTFTGAGVLDLDATAGQVLSTPIQAVQGDQGSLRYGVSRTFDGPIDAGALPAGLTLSSDGVLSGSTTEAQTVDFWVLVRTAQEPNGAPGQHVQLRIGLAADSQVTAVVGDRSSSDYRSWSVSADGTTSFHTSPEAPSDDPSRPITTTVGGALYLGLGSIDRYGNRSFYDTVDNDWSSSVASDTIDGYDAGTVISFTTPGTHVLTGTTPEGRTIRFSVQVGPAAETGAATELAVVVRGQGTATTAPTWLVAPDGSVTYSDSSEVQTGDPTTPIRVRQDGSLELDALGFDQQGDVVPGLDDLTWSSSVAGDTFTPTASTDAVTLRFAHASTHVITARSGALSRTFTVEVDPLPAASTTARAGTLAFTGADETGPLAWALGLLAAGGVLLVHRMRRRRV